MSQEQTKLFTTTQQMKTFFESHVRHTYCIDLTQISVTLLINKFVFL